MVKSQNFDDILGNIDHKKKIVQHKSKIFINYTFCVSKSCCENAFPGSSIGSKFRCSFWQSIWSVLVTWHNPDDIKIF